MATIRRLACSVAGALLIAGGMSSAHAQDLPTVPEVVDDLNASCVITNDGPPVTFDGCLEAVARSIGTANAYDLLPTVPPQVDIGFYLCRLMVLQPVYATSVVELIDLSGNFNLALGCSNALDDDWTGPVPISNSPA